MKKTYLSAIVAVSILSISGCTKHKHGKNAEKNINYPAAFVVNGESSTLSVIRLSDNKVAETIELAGEGHAGHQGLFPHHIYLHKSTDGDLLTVAAPGMDLSAGHTGGTAGMKGKILILDAVKGTTIKNIEVPAMNHNAIYSPDGSEIWTTQMEHDGKVLVIDANTFAVKNTINVGEDPAEVTFSADGTKAYVANGGSNTVSIINPTTKAIITTIPVDANPVAAWVGYDGKMYVDNEEGKTVTVIDVATNAVVQTINLGFMPGSVAHNLIKKELWVTDPNAGKVHYWTLNASSNTWVKVGSFDAGGGAHAVAFTNDGNTAYVTNQSAHTVSIINVATHAKVKDVAVGKKPNGIVIKY